jgi:catechol 2,3-dioxygenase-like lactoylglutathione lyase family enzyme
MSNTAAQHHERSAAGEMPRPNERRTMEAHIDVITLAVADLDRSLEFYRDGLGLETEGVIATEFTGDELNAAGAIVMFKLGRGLILSLYPRTELAKDASVPLGAPKTGEFSIGHIVETRSDVDAVLAQARAAGATLTASPRDRPWGIYSGYFRDPDGHLWEIICNPGMGNDTAP